MKNIVLLLITFALLATYAYHKFSPPSLAGSGYTVLVHYVEDIPLEHTFVSVVKDGEVVFDATPRVLQQRIEALEYEITKRESTKWMEKQDKLDGLRIIQQSLNTKLRKYPDVATTTKILPTR